MVMSHVQDKKNHIAASLHKPKAISLGSVFAVTLQSL